MRDWGLDFRIHRSFMGDDRDYFPPARFHFRLLSS